MGEALSLEKETNSTSFLWVLSYDKKVHPGPHKELSHAAWEWFP